MSMTRVKRDAVLGIAVAILAATAIAWAGSQGGVSRSGLPLFAGAIALAFIIQWIAFIPAYRLQSERFFDLTGSFTYLSVIGIVVIFSPTIDTRSLVLLCLVAIWAIRLGTFLSRRIRKAGKDARFDEIKPSFVRFLMTWTLQGLWVSFTLAAALAAITTTVRQPFGIPGLIGLAIWTIGFGMEVIADAQKNRFRSDPKNKGDFIHTGLWSWSRHPNYFGEITLWTGIALIAVPVLRGWQWTALISPLFVTLLITRVSGVPMLEKRADEKWGGQEAYEAYKHQTSVLIPWPPRRNQR